MNPLRTVQFCASLESFFACLPVCSLICKIDKVLSSNIYSLKWQPDQLQALHNQLLLIRDDFEHLNVEQQIYGKSWLGIDKCEAWVAIRLSQAIPKLIVSQQVEYTSDRATAQYIHWIELKCQLLKRLLNQYATMPINSLCSNYVEDMEDLMDKIIEGLEEHNIPTPPFKPKNITSLQELKQILPRGWSKQHMWSIMSQKSPAHPAESIVMDVWYTYYSTTAPASDKV